MEKLAQHDPLALTAIEFNVKSVKKYTSVATILMSLGIVALSVIFNLESIKHIWIPLHELPILYSEEKFSEHVQTEGNIVCFSSPIPFSFIPKFEFTIMEEGELRNKRRTHL